MQPMTSWTFLKTLGVDTHIAYTDGGYANVPKVIADLQFLGITQVRDGISNGQNGSAPLSSYIAIARAGIRFSFIIEASSTIDLNTQLGLINQVEAAVPGSVIGIEGPNEINNQPVTYNGISGLQGALNEQQAIYAAVHTDPALAGVPVDYFTGYGAGSIPVGPDPSTTPGLADNDTQHPYPNFGQAPAAWVARARALSNETSPTGPAVYTETGYSSANVAADVQAKYELDLLMDTAKQGISKTFLYELMDAYAPGSRQGDDGWGVFDYTGAPKLVASSLHNLTTLLADSGANASSFTPTPVNDTITGLPSSGNSLLLQKSDGTNIVAVWAEPQIWNNTAGVEIAPPSNRVTVAFSQSYATVEVYDPLIGTAPIAIYKNTNTVTFTVTTHPILVKTSAAAPVTTPPSDTLVLALAEDAYQGDAQFSVAVDGKAVGGGTVTALKSAGQSENFSFSGSFGAGAHIVTINFLNDAYVFSSAGILLGDRNLYVNAITLDGVTTVENAAQDSGGATSYSIRAASTTAAPAVTITSQTLAQDTGASATDFITSNGAVTLTGTVVGATGTVVRIVDGSTTLGNATVSGTAWSFTTSLGAGTHALHAVAMDPSGNTGITPAQSVITVETIAPSVTIAMPVESSGTTVLTGSLTGASDTKVEIFNGSDDLGPATLGAGTWQFSATLPAGSYDFTALATDLAGNSASAGYPIFTVPATNPGFSAAADIVMANVSNGSTVVQQSVNISAGAANRGTYVPITPAGTLGASPIVTYNWQPISQLANFAGAVARAGTGAPPASIVAMGDSTTRGYGASQTGWSALSYVSELAQSLTQDGLAAQTANFFADGVSISNGLTEDTRVALVGGATAPFVVDAGGLAVETTGAGQGIDFTLDAPGTFDRVNISYIDIGSGTVNIALNGGPVLATLQLGNTGQTLTQTVDVPTGTYQQLNIRAASANPAYIEGAALWDSGSKSIEVFNAGIDGWDSGATDTSTYNGATLTGSAKGYGPTAGVTAITPSLVLIDLGINDIVRAQDTTAQTLTHITDIVASLRAAGSDVIVVIPQPFNDPAYSAALSALRAGLQALSTAQNIPLIDLSATYGNNAAALAAAGLMADTVHPDATLYADIGSGIAALLAKATGATATPAAAAQTRATAVTAAAGFTYNLGEGAITIAVASGAGAQMLHLGAGINPASTSLVRASGNLVVTDGVPGDTVTVSGLFGQAEPGVSGIQFSDGTIWTASQMAFTASNGTIRPDSITGTPESDVIDGRGGGDTVAGNGGDDTYIFRQGYGALQISNGTAAGTMAAGQLDFGTGLTASNLWFSRNGSDLKVTALHSGDWVTVEGWYGANGSAQLTSFVGGDGLRLSGGVASLVSAMTAYQAAHPGFSPATAPAMPADPTLSGAIAAAWHA